MPEKEDLSVWSALSVTRVQGVNFIKVIEEDVGEGVFSAFFECMQRHTAPPWSGEVAAFVCEVHVGPGHSR